MNKIEKTLVVIGMVLCMIMPVYAEKSILDSVAVITDHSGTALVFSDGKWNPAEINMPIYEGDGLRTKSDSALEITFDDATIIKLGPNTDLKLSAMKRNQNVATTVFSLIKGRFLAIVDKLKNADSRFEVHTKMAIAAVKGTEFAITADDSETNLGVFEGAVEFKGEKGKVLVGADNESTVLGDLHRKKDKVGVPEKPKKLIKLAYFKVEIEKMREEIKIIRELKQKGNDEVIQYRIKKKLQKQGKVTGESDTQITIGGTNENTGKIKEKVQQILKNKLRKELYNEKSHAYRDLKFINEEMKADVHLGKTMTDVHGNRIRMEEFIYRPAANQVNLLSLTLREGRLDYLKGENIFVNAIDDDIAWSEWKRMWQKEWYYVAPRNYLKEQRIVLSNVNDWVFTGVLYAPTLWSNAGIVAPTLWKLLKHTEILAFTKAGAPSEPIGDMTVANFIINPDNHQYVREHRIYGGADAQGNQQVFKGILDKTYNSTTEYQSVVDYWYNIEPGNSEYEQIRMVYKDLAMSEYSNIQPIEIPYSEKNESLFDLNKLAMRHTRYYNDGSNLSLGVVLIDDYGFIQELPKPDASALDKAIWLIDIVLNTNVELIVKSNQFADKKMGIDVVSKMLWWIMLNPQNKDNKTPVQEVYSEPGYYTEPGTVGP
jgi:hypothetical protein